MYKLTCSITLIILLTSVQCTGQKKEHITKANNNNTLLWQVTGKGIKPTYLYGTMHLLCAEDAVLSNNVKNIIQQVDKVYFELDMDDMAAMMGVITKMNMRDGVQLKDLLTATEYDKVKNYFANKKSMLPFSMMEKYKPIMLASTIMQEDMPCKKGISGIEMKMMEYNSTFKNKKEILGLEPVTLQVAIFDSIPYKEQATMLVQYIDSAAITSKQTQKLVVAYLSQNLKTLEELVTKSEPGLEKYTDILLTNRNKDWVNQLQVIGKTKSFIAAVGAAHLVGNAGVLQLLKNAGYTVIPLNNTTTKLK